MNNIIKSPPPSLPKCNDWFYQLTVFEGAITDGYKDYRELIREHDRRNQPCAHGEQMISSSRRCRLVGHHRDRCGKVPL